MPYPGAENPTAAQDYNIGSYNQDIQQKAETLRSVTQHMDIHVPTGVFLLSHL